MAWVVALKKEERETTKAGIPTGRHEGDEGHEGGRGRHDQISKFTK
jgi:hypothetical protein